MPFVVKHSGGPEYKKYGVHNGSRCRLKAWQLDEKDEANLHLHDGEEFIVLEAIPKILDIEPKIDDVDVVAALQIQHHVEKSLSHGFLFLFN